MRGKPTIRKTLITYGGRFLLFLLYKRDAHYMWRLKRIIQEKIIILLLEIQYRNKKRCTNCQGHKEIKRFLKQKLKEQLNKEQVKPQETKEVELSA